MSRNSRPISWVKAARKEFQKFPATAQTEVRFALTLAAEGRKADIAKPMKGLGPGVFEIALAYFGDAYRTIYILQLAEAIWVIHAFRKKAKRGIKTPQKEIELIRRRIRRLKEMLRDG
jgi:phage-related protein